MLVRKMSAKLHAEAVLGGDPWKYLRTKFVKANYAELGPETILSREEGGVLAHVMVREPVHLHNLVEQIGTKDELDDAQPADVIAESGSWTAASLLDDLEASDAR